MKGPGKYDDICTIARERTDAQAVIVLVIGGKRGSGFSVQSLGQDITALLPALLRSMADDIERDGHRNRS